jgi:hypothetical protein
MKYLISAFVLVVMIGCDQRLELKSDTKAQIYDKNKLVYQSDCVAIATFDVNEQNMGVLHLKDGSFMTTEVRTYDMADKNHSYVFKKTTCK